MERWQWLQNLELRAILIEAREQRLPVWAQFKINRLRYLLEAEARENDSLRAEIERLQ